jgi:hypothetical protein
MNTGIPDILATRPGGSLHLEVKALGDALRDSQLNWAIDYYALCCGDTWAIFEQVEGYSVVSFGAPGPKRIRGTGLKLEEAVACILTSTM